MTPADAIDMLDRQIAQHGQDVVLRRAVTNQPAIEKPCRAWVRGYRPDELVGGIKQGDTQIVISPTDLPAEFSTVLLKANDAVQFDNRRRNVEYVDPVRINGVLVRLNALVRG